MNAARVLPGNEGKFRTNGRGRNYSLPQSAIVASMPPPPSSPPLQDDGDYLLAGKLDIHSQPFDSAFAARFARHFGNLISCNAVTFPPILLRADGRTDLLEIGGPLLGAIEGAEFDSDELILSPGDTLVAYSDGVLECRNTSDE